MALEIYVWHASHYYMSGAVKITQLLADFSQIVCVQRCILNLHALCAYQGQWGCGTVCCIWIRYRQTAWNWCCLINVQILGHRIVIVRSMNNFIWRELWRVLSGTGFMYIWKRDGLWRTYISSINVLHVASNFVTITKSKYCGLLQIATKQWYGLMEFRIYKSK